MYVYIVVSLSDIIDGQSYPFGQIRVDTDCSVKDAPMGIVLTNSAGYS